jgi:hypothetical protein
MLSEAIAGHVMPWVALAGKLVSRGHRVSYLTTDGYAAAPTLERARREGLLPRYDECVRHYQSMRNDRK